MIKKIKPPVDYPKDCERIKKALKMFGYSATLQDCEKFWQWKSAEYCACWLSLPESDDALEEIINWSIDEYIEEFQF